MQVMSEAADQCVRSMLNACPTAKAVPVIVQAATKDKNAKIRQFCSSYLVQVSQCPACPCCSFWGCPVSSCSQVLSWYFIKHLACFLKACCFVLIQILERWEPAIYQKHVDDLEAAMKNAVQDASAETRQKGRAMYAAYSAAFPETAAAFFRRLEPALQDKMCKAATEPRRGMPGLII